MTKRAHKTECPRCNQLVAVVDGHLAHHGYHVHSAGGARWRAGDNGCNGNGMSMVHVQEERQARAAKGLADAEAAVVRALATLAEAEAATDLPADMRAKWILTATKGVERTRMALELARRTTA